MAGAREQDGSNQDEEPRLWEAKEHQTHEIEERWAVEGSRQVLHTLFLCLEGTLLKC